MTNDTQHRKEILVHYIKNNENGQNEKLWVNRLYDF